MIARPVHIFPTPEELAQEWWGLGSDQQARFFNRLASADIMRQLPMQLAYLRTEPGLTDEARGVMQLIGEYAPK